MDPCNMGAKVSPSNGGASILTWASAGRHLGISPISHMVGVLLGTLPPWFVFFFPITNFLDFSHGLALSIDLHTSMAGKVDLSASRVTTVTICYAVPIPFMILLTGLRLFVVLRPSSKHHIHFDDYMITISTVRANFSFYFLLLLYILFLFSLIYPIF